MATVNDSPSSSSTSATISSSSEANNPNPNPNPNHNPSSNSSNAIHSWRESVSKARFCIHALSSLLASPSILPLMKFDHPAHSLLNYGDAYLAISAARSHPSTGSGNDPLCQWLYETYQSSYPDLCLTVLSFIPLLTIIYLTHVVTSSSSTTLGSASSLTGFKAILLTLYGSEAKACTGKPLFISVPDLSQPSLYHTPSKPSALTKKATVGVLSPPLELQIVVKSTKHACIVGITLDYYFKKISHMPPCSKMDFCEFVSSWAGQDYPCQHEFDEKVNWSSSPEMRSSNEDGGDIGNVAEEMGSLAIQDGLNGKCNGENVERSSRRGSRVLLPWELLQPVLRILGHCLLAH